MFKEIAFPNSFSFPGAGNVVYVAARFSEEVVDGNHPLLAGYDGILKTAISQRRRADFLAGRLCAALCLQRLGIVDTFVAPPVSPLLPPIWPLGTVGSITHSKNVAAAAVAQQREIRCLGVDVEGVLNEIEAQDVQEIVTTRAELESHEATQLSRGELLASLFSAKESVYKGLFPFTRVEFSFLDVSVRLDPAAGRFSFSVEKSLPGVPREGEGSFAMHESMVYTSVVLHEERGFL